MPIMIERSGILPALLQAGAAYLQGHQQGRQLRDQKQQAEAKETADQIEQQYQRQQQADAQDYAQRQQALQNKQQFYQSLTGPGRSPANADNEAALLQEIMNDQQALSQWRPTGPEFIAKAYDALPAGQNPHIDRHRALVKQGLQTGALHAALAPTAPAPSAPGASALTGPAPSEAPANPDLDWLMGAAPAAPTSLSPPAVPQPPIPVPQGAPTPAQTSSPLAADAPGALPGVPDGTSPTGAAGKPLGVPMLPAPKPVAPLNPSPPAIPPTVNVPPPGAELLQGLGLRKPAGPGVAPASGMGAAHAVAPTANPAVQAALLQAFGKQLNPELAAPIVSEPVAAPVAPALMAPVPTSPVIPAAPVPVAPAPAKPVVAPLAAASATPAAPDRPTVTAYGRKFYLPQTLNATDERAYENLQNQYGSRASDPEHETDADTRESYGRVATAAMQARQAGVPYAEFLRQHPELGAFGTAALKPTGLAPKGSSEALRREISANAKRATEIAALLHQNGQADEAKYVDSVLDQLGSADYQTTAGQKALEGVNRALLGVAASYPGLTQDRQAKQEQDRQRLELERGFAADQKLITGGKLPKPDDFLATATRMQAVRDHPLFQGQEGRFALPQDLDPTPQTVERPAPVRRAAAASGPNDGAEADAISVQETPQEARARVLFNASQRIEGAQSAHYQRAALGQYFSMMRSRDFWTMDPPARAAIVSGLNELLQKVDPKLAQIPSDIQEQLSKRDTAHFDYLSQSLAERKQRDTATENARNRSLAIAQQRYDLQNRKFESDVRGNLQGVGRAARTQLWAMSRDEAAARKAYFDAIRANLGFQKAGKLPKDEDWTRFDPVRAAQDLQQGRYAPKITDPVTEKLVANPTDGRIRSILNLYNDWQQARGNLGTAMQGVQSPGTATPAKAGTGAGAAPSVAPDHPVSTGRPVGWAAPHEQAYQDQLKAYKAKYGDPSPIKRALIQQQILGTH